MLDRVLTVRQEGLRVPVDRPDEGLYRARTEAFVKKMSSLNVVINPLTSE